MMPEDLKELLRAFNDHAVEFVAIRQEVNSLFPEINPEPIEPHVKAAQEMVVREKCHGGLITDGDADRIGAVAEDEQERPPRIGLP